MNDLRKYSREFVLEFIDLYKSLPAVWKIKSQEYSNRDLKTQAYAALVEKWKEVEPRANRAFVVKKINSMRTIYRRELKKIANGYSGMGTNRVPSSNLWYFHYLDFLRDQKVSRSSTSSLKQENTLNIIPIEYLESVSDQISSPSPTATSASPIPPRSPTPARSPSPRRPKKRKQNFASSILTQISNPLDEPLPKLDRCDYMAKAWAETLRSLPNEQRIFAERIISDVLSEAQLTTLTRESHLQVQLSSKMSLSQTLNKFES